jgi:rubrerythrin
MCELPFAASASIGAFLYEVRREGFSVVVKTHGGAIATGIVRRIRRMEPPNPSATEVLEALSSTRSADSRGQRRSREALMCSRCGWRMNRSELLKVCPNCGNELFHP